MILLKKALLYFSKMVSTDGECWIPIGQIPFLLIPVIFDMGHLNLYIRWWVCLVEGICASKATYSDSVK